MTNSVLNTGRSLQSVAVILRGFCSLEDKTVVIAGLTMVQLCEQSYNFLYFLSWQPALWIYCPHPSSGGKTSLRCDLTPTATLMNRVHLAAVTLSAGPSSSLCYFMHNKRHGSSHLGEIGPRALTEKGWKGGTVQSFDLNSSVGHRDGGGAKRKIFGFTLVQNANMFF